MKKILLFVSIILLMCGSCYADVIKGDIEKVNIKDYEMIVNGERVKMPKAIVFTENDMGVGKTIIIRDLKDHVGEKAICYGSMGKDGVFNAYRIKVIEGHR